MRGTTGICAGLALLAAAPAGATDQDTQTWVTGTVAGSPAKDWNASLDVSQRFRDPGDQQLVRGIVEYRLSSHLSIGGGATYVWADNAPNEVRPHQQLTVTFGQLAVRSVLEERLFDGADRAEIRLRERARVTEALGRSTRASEAVELLYILQPQNRLTKARWDSWRGIVQLQQKLSRHLDGSVGYQFVYAPRPTGADKISHIPLLSLTWRP